MPLTFDKHCETLLDMFVLLNAVAFQATQPCYIGGWLRVTRNRGRRDHNRALNLGKTT